MLTTDLQCGKCWPQVCSVGNVDHRFAEVGNVDHRFAVWEMLTTDQVGITFTFYSWLSMNAPNFIQNMKHVSISTVSKMNWALHVSRNMERQFTISYTPDGSMCIILASICQRLSGSAVCVRMAKCYKILCYILWYKTLCKCYVIYYDIRRYANSICSYFFSETFTFFFFTRFLKSLKVISLVVWIEYVKHTNLIVFFQNYTNNIILKTHILQPLAIFRGSMLTSNDEWLIWRHCHLWSLLLLKYQSWIQ